MEPPELKAHVEKDPDQRGYSEMSPTELLADLTRKQRRGPYYMRLNDFGKTVGWDTTLRFFNSLSDYAAKHQIAKGYLGLLLAGVEIDIDDICVRNIIDFMAHSTKYDLLATDKNKFYKLTENLLTDAEYYELGELFLWNITGKA